MKKRALFEQGHFVFGGSIFHPILSDFPRCENNHKMLPEICKRNPLKKYLNTSLIMAHLFHLHVVLYH